MNRYLPSGFTMLAVTALLALAATSPAEARIECQGAVSRSPNMA